MSGKKCPACGSVLEATAAVCSSCGLGDLNRIFLSRTEREQWVRQVLEPHKRTLTPRVFAGAYHTLLLTGSGALYGIGGNGGEQICSDGDVMYETPQLMATEVIDAAAGLGYSIFVTKDGQVHLQGLGILGERFPGFSGAKRVFASHDQDQFWIIDQKGEIFCFGDNSCSEKMVALKRKVLKAFPEEFCTVNFGGEWETMDLGSEHGTESYYHTWDTVYQEERALKWKLERNAQYRQLGKLYGNDNIEAHLKLVSCRVLDGKSKSDSNRREMREYIPQAILTNSYIFTPVPAPDQSLEDSTHRMGSKPIPFPEEYTENPCGIRKICTMDRSALVLYENGVAELAYRGGNTVLDWKGQKAVDVALGSNEGAVVYQNGDVVLFNSRAWTLPYLNWKKDRVPVNLPGGNKT